MSTAIHCDGPECTSWLKTGRHFEDNAGFLTVYWGNLVTDNLDFCSWDCCIKYGATKPPLTIISE
jgi:hypothetical protein